MSKVKVGKRLFDVEKLKEDVYDIIPIYTNYCMIQGCRKKAKYFINFHTGKLELTAAYVCKEHVKLFDNYPYK